MVARGVVNFLESIEVQEQHAQRDVLPLRARDRGRQPVVEQCAIRKAGQRVVQRLLA